MEHSNQLRRGAWTQEEDKLLRSYIEEHGEGKWYLVPDKAGLKRCRKSCRLRWLNYLKPSIRKGKFMDDEIDLMIKLHKLLGNRWSLIAGRLPGRTANDVKNFWNTHHGEKSRIRHDEKVEAGKAKAPVTVYRPRPWTFKKTYPSTHDSAEECKKLHGVEGPTSDTYSRPPAEAPVSPLEDGFRWESLLSDDAGDMESGSFFHVQGFVDNNDEVRVEGSFTAQNGMLCEGQLGLLSFDSELWSFLDAE